MIRLPARKNDSIFYYLMMFNDLTFDFNKALQETKNHYSMMFFDLRFLLLIRLFKTSDKNLNEICDVAFFIRLLKRKSEKLLNDVC